MKPKILIIEDEVKLSEVINSYLEKEGYMVYQAKDGKTGQELFRQITPNLLILDLMLPDISGEEICQNIRKISDVPIIMITAKIQEANILNGFKIGADDYITKPFNVKQLVAKVKVFLNRTYKDKDKISINDKDLIIDHDNYEVLKKGQKVLLTKIEYKLLEVFVHYKNKVFTRDELIQIVLSDDFDGYDRIIDAHIKNLRQKIETNPKQPEYILTVHGIGYKFGGKID
jgi:DNA-binding response OmpR family regulator